MAITGINNSSYTSYYASNYKNTVKKTDSEKDSTNTKDGNVTTSTVELKTSRPGVTKTEQIKTGYSNVNDYSKYLQGKYHYMNTGTTSMQGVPTTVSVSSAFLQKCMNDPEKAKYLEENLAAIPDCAKSAVNGCLGTLTNLSYKVDENGNISVAISGTNDPDGKIAKENAERKVKENREKEKKEKEKKSISLESIRKVFPKWSKGRDYYLALIGKLCQGIGNFAVTGYILYIMTDFLMMGDGTQSAIQLINTIMLGFGILMGFFAGPISDRFNILKLPVGFSVIFLALGAGSLFLFRDMTGISIYAVCAGIGMGMWNSLDNLLNLKVIPDKNRVAFFLGVYNLGNTVTQAVAPIIAATVISIFGFSSVFFVAMAFSLVGGLCVLSIKSLKR